mgnify:CR=1 FL=1
MIVAGGCGLTLLSSRSHQSCAVIIRDDQHECALNYCMNDGGVQMRVSDARIPMRQQRTSEAGTAASRRLVGE